MPRRAVASGRRRPASTRTAPLGRTTASLLALVVVAATATGCDAVRGPGAAGDGDGGAQRRTETKAPNPPPGLPASLTAGQRLHWTACPPLAPAPAPSVSASASSSRGGGAPGAGWDCATMRAPLDYRRPGGSTIGVALIRKRATGPESGRIGSLVFDFGGPGKSGVTGLVGFAHDYRTLGKRYDLVGFDPRGVRATAPVRCGKTEFEGAEVCAKYSGRLLPYVGTTHTARDMDLLRYLLGDEKLHYFGVSYGTGLGGVYAHLFPGNVGRIVLEAPVDPTQDRFHQDLDQVRAVQSAFERFAQYCAKTREDCPTGSDPAQADRRVTALLDRLRDKPARTADGGRLDADLAAHAIANHLDLGEKGWGPLADALGELVRHGTGTALLRKAYDHAPGARSRSAAAGGTPPVDNSVSAYVAITCADSDSRPGFTEAEAMSKRIEAASPVFGTAWSSSVYLCYDWPFKGERADLDVRAPGAAPVLVVAGTGDPTTPYEGGRHMADELGDQVGVLLTVRAEGHGTYGYDDCATGAVDTYLLDGTPPARGTTCS
ncbi:alpha/beta hydrolase [Streptomyces sp. NPDC003703]|uniref:alpha/beta hydrolase n=1 Tax=Streptomyces sp. NPDC003283 TaxID=3364681 RepID=UPI0036AA8559